MLCNGNPLGCKSFSQIKLIPFSTDLDKQRRRYVGFWTHADVPADVISGIPDTAAWGLPVVAFNGDSGCNIDSYFANMNIIVDITFCGA